ncbi:MAG: hypothetical protein K1X94_13955 [Sandaracinaceae bacterium]|nr:hypothetical protein [Sandaracinaceae bacterium]
MLPSDFEVPFSFRGDVVMRGRANGASTDRCVFDTGAARTVLRVPDLRLVPGLIVADGMASVRLEMEGVDLGDVVANEVLVVRDAFVGGRAVTLELVCAGEGDFGGAAARGPDGGIVGAGALARSGHELQIIDFVSNRFVLA